jgi:hypothetical protein
MVQSQIIPLVYRIAALIVAGVYLFSSPELTILFASPGALMTIAIILTTLVSIPPFMWSIGRSPLPGTLMIAAELVVCFILIMLSGSIYSPFILFFTFPNSRCRAFSQQKNNLHVCRFQRHIHYIDTAFQSFLHIGNLAPGIKPAFFISCSRLSYSHTSLPDQR